jgi:extracellular factor (EF) 3-hydroxypalmitic acid methyl ester biosynthesis protein
MSVAAIEQVEGAVVGSQSRRSNQRLRPNRVRLDGLLRDDIVATSWHPILGSVRGRALDLSIHGARVAVPLLDGQVEAALLGDRLERLVLECNGAMLYEGTATVVRSTFSAGQHELGLMLESASIDLAAVYRLVARRTADERWQLAREQNAYASLEPRFRSWVAELVDNLVKARSFLDAEEAAIAGWDMTSRLAVADELLAVVGPDVVARMNQAGIELRELVGHLTREQHEDYRAYCHTHLGPLLSASPFLHRARSKPLGYAGDYEMMNMLYRDHAEGATLFGKALNLYATQSPVAQANINRIEFLGRKIEAAIAAKPKGRVRIASVGCGPAQEIQSFLTTRPELGQRLEIALIDQEERAISYCERALAPLAAKSRATVRVIRESVRRLLTDKKLSNTLGECELIYSAGLFDYLNDRTFDALIGKLWGAVAEGGVLAVGNVAALNPDRYAMEYFTEWFLNHRSPENLHARGRMLNPTPSKIEVGSEPLGVNLFLILNR